MIHKRAAFLVSHHQHTDPSKWYVGVYSDWDQKNEILRGPEDRDSLSAWLTDANDDAGNARPAFIASKNVFFPNQTEIESLELYISKYLWGGMQMTDKEKYPYAIYGIPNWKVNRASPDEGRNGQAHVWRIYDYPHIVMLYYRMYQHREVLPGRGRSIWTPTSTSSARTVRPSPTGPSRCEIEKWSADAVGTMNEAFIPELIQTLEDEGKTEWAATLRGLLGRQGRSLRQPDAEPLRIGVRVRFDGVRVHGRVREVRHDARARARPQSSSRPAGGRLQATRPVRRRAEVHELPAAAQHVGSRLARDDLLPARERLSGDRCRIC